jgi:hypothetical protein
MFGATVKTIDCNGAKIALSCCRWQPEERARHNEIVLK